MYLPKTSGDIARGWVPWAVLLLAFLVPGAAPAQTTTPMDSVLTFGESEVQSPFLLFNDLTGVSVTVLGTVLDTRPPLDGIVTDGVEVTYVLDGMDDGNWVIWDSSNGECGGVVYEFQAGSFRVYLDNSPDRNLNDPATFEDGQLLLEGTVSEYWVESGAYPCQPWYPGHGGWVDFTGGDLFDRVSRNGIGYRGRIDQTSRGDAPLDSLGAPSYSFPTHGWMTLYVPVPVHETTWGKIKLLYGHASGGLTDTGS